MPDYVLNKLSLVVSRCIPHKIALTVPDLGSRDRDVVLVRRKACWGNPKGGREFGMGGTREDLRRVRSVYEQPGTKVDRVASRQRRVSK